MYIFLCAFYGHECGPVNHRTSERANERTNENFQAPTQMPNNNDRIFCVVTCMRYYTVLHDYIWLCGDRWMRFTRLISSIQNTMCVHMCVSLRSIFLYMHFLGSLIQCCRQSRYAPYTHTHTHTYIKLWNGNSQVKFSRGGWPAMCRQTVFFSIHSVNILYIFQINCVCVCVVHILTLFECFTQRIQKSGSLMAMTMAVVAMVAVERM